QYLIQIEQALESRSMTQKELADKIGTSASYISQFFNLNKLINFKTLAKIELALDINFELKKPTASGLNHINKIEKFYNKPNQTISNVNFIASNDELFAA
ncbi:MAG: helix-turn-helix transcriptional regulator, partial [Gammaproteobacteria bacterium]|nr:helix-turn-helix transcriptional regulator [Gammaproteobacteria bacterium]